MYIYTTNQNDELYLWISDIFRLNDFGIKIGDHAVKSVEDKKELEIVKATLKEIGHLWRDETEKLPDIH